MREFASALLGSVITLLISAVIDCIKEKIRERRCRDQAIFERKIAAAERAMAWCQTAIDNFLSFKIVCDKIETSSGIIIEAVMQQSTERIKTIMDNRTKYDELGLYYDMRDIEMRFQVSKAAMNMYDRLNDILKLNAQIIALRNSGVDNDDHRVVNLQQDGVKCFKELSLSLDAQINSLVAQQERLRKDFRNR